MKQAPFELIAEWVWQAVMDITPFVIRNDFQKAKISEYELNQIKEWVGEMFEVPKSPLREERIQQLQKNEFRDSFLNEEFEGF